MKHSFAIFTVMILLVSCSKIGESNLNPLNWFGDSNAEKTIKSVPVKATSIDPRARLQRVTEITNFVTTNGIIIVAKGLPPTQGFWNPALLPRNEEKPVDGFLTYEFRAQAPTDQVLIGTERSREIEAAKTITQDKLVGVKGIRIIARDNTMTLAL